MKSLFSKLLGTYVLIILLSLGTLGVFFQIFFSNYYFNFKEQQLIAQGQELSKLLSPYLAEKKEAQIVDLVNVFNRVNKQSIWVVDKNGLIIGSSQGLTIKNGICTESSELQKALQGNVVTKQGHVAHLREPVLTAAVPIYVDNFVEGAVFVCNPISEITAGINQARKIVFGAGILAVLIIAFFSYFLSRSISRPLKEMTEVAQEIAKGNFASKVQVRSADEVGKLAETFNYMAVTLDRTLRDLEEEKNKTASMERLQREFVANVSHELRTPLTSVRGFLEAILDGVVEGREQVDKYLNIMLKETVRLHKMVTSLLDLSRIESGQTKVDKKELAIGQIIERTAANLEPLIEDHQLSLKLNLPKGIPSSLGDEHLVEQVLINFLTNAIRFTPAGGKITVSAGSEQGEVCVHVADTGLGIPADELPHVWKRFYKVDKARTLAKGGAGLGLALVKEIVELLGGRVWVESTFGWGSTFSFSLPFKTK